MSVIALRQPLIGGLAAGKWDRFATFGEKIQDGQAFTFSTETLSQIVDNFTRLYKGRRIGMDFEHQALNAATNGQPAPELARYNALAVVEGGQVGKFYSQDAAVSPPDPAALMAEIRARFPDDPDADGLWGYRCEHTPLGAELLPNYSQISPLFSAEDSDEQGNPIGYRLMNVSAVNVAFQDRTVLNLSKRALGFGDSSLHAPEPVKSKGAKMADKDEKDDEMPSALRSECMKKLGLPDDASDDAMFGALMAQKFGEEKKEEEEEKPAPMAADLPEMPGAMGALKSRVEEESRARVAMEAELVELRKERQARKGGEWRTFSAQFLSEGSAAKFLDAQGGDADKAIQALSALDLPRRTGLSQRLTQGGAPIGADPVQQGSGVETVAGLKIIGRGLSAMAKTIMDKGEAKTLGDAQLIAARRAPHLYSR